MVVPVGGAVIDLSQCVGTPALMPIMAAPVAVCDGAGQRGHGLQFQEMTMLSKMKISLAVLLLAGGACAVPALAQSAAHHDHAAHATHAVPATPAQRWATDAPLRAGMRAIREATELLNHYQMGHLDDTQRDNAVAQIDAAIKDMIAHCKLKPDADAALHGLLAKFIAGANAARAGKFSQAELAPMQQALAKYPTLFVDAEWGKAAE